MSTKSFQLSNKGQREFARVKEDAIWIIKTSDSYQEAFNKISKINIFGDRIPKSTVVSILTAKDMINLNPKIKRKSKTSSGEELRKVGKKGSKKK